jgi:hypothetical protein
MTSREQYRKAKCPHCGWIRHIPHGHVLVYCLINSITPINLATDTFS